MGLRVLLVDDDERFRAAACRALAADGVEVVAEVDNGLDVAAAAAQWRPEVILLDMNLPDIDGREVARRLQTEESEAVVILISTRDAAHGRRLAAGLAAGYLPKDQLSLGAILELVPNGPPSRR
ncbi:response regulator transcription factor [Sporichthya polymorpha]|uniref:response regulator transcription factor n=1 Tax=Sporichthya polymorpha TaxID=35751 RepID=UPI000375589E|nr:response regulator [Sporichthya polymorpha]